MVTPFRTRRRVEFADTDMAGIVHFANFFRYMEAAEVDFLSSLDLSVAMSWEGQKLGLPRVSASCDFVKPARFLDVIEITVMVKRVGTKSVTYGFEFFNSAGELLARGQISAVCCKVGAGRELESVAIPTGMRERLQTMQNGES